MTKDKTAFKTEGNKPFALLQVPDCVMGDITENPHIVDEIKRLIGIDVLIVRQDVNLTTGKMALEEAKRLHDEIGRFLADQGESDNAEESEEKDDG